MSEDCPAYSMNSMPVGSNHVEMNQGADTSSFDDETLVGDERASMWVFEQGIWQRNHNFWLEVQKASWDGVVLKEGLKRALQRDVEGFFASENMYKDMSISWKRGLILYGPPGNGKTLSLKAIMKSCSDSGINPLYVKSLHGPQDKASAIVAVFEMARKTAPCVVILEDLESLIDYSNQSLFLNELDGIASNHGILFIGTTNHLERLDPALSNRPGRFDRKYHFQNPGDVERLVYVHDWVDKVRAQGINMPLGTVEEIAWLSSSLSFSHLNEAFVSSIVMCNGIKGQSPSFSTVLRVQIETLRQQLSKTITPTAMPNHNNDTLRPRILSQPTNSPKVENSARSNKPLRDPMASGPSLYRPEKRRISSGEFDECICPSNNTSYSGCHSEAGAKSSGSIVVGLIDRIANPGRAPPIPPWADTALFLFLVCLLTVLYLVYAQTYIR